MSSVWEFSAVMCVRDQSSSQRRRASVVEPEPCSREFEVSRTVVREAIKVLAAKGLLDAGPRTGTRITERAGPVRRTRPRRPRVPAHRPAGCGQ